MDKINHLKSNNLKPRTWHYVQNPANYEITCDKCNGSNIQWSEFEGLIWCYDCKIDTKGTAGIFDGPIPVSVCEVLGISFDKYDMIGKFVIPFKKDKKMEKCFKCEEPNMGREIVKALDSHNNVVEYKCKACDFKDTKIEPIDDKSN